MGSGVGGVGTRRSPSIQENQGVDAPAKTNQTKETAPAQDKAGAAVGGDQYSPAKGKAPDSPSNTSLQAPDTLKRSPRNEAAPQSDVKIPEVTIKSANQKIVDQTTSQVKDLVKKGDPASLKSAVDKLFTLKEPELAATLKNLSDSRDLMKLYENSGKDNRARLVNTVMGHGSEESKKIFGDGIHMNRQEMLDSINNGFGMAKVVQDQHKTTPPPPPQEGWGKP